MLCRPTHGCNIWSNMRLEWSHTGHPRKSYTAAKLVMFGPCGPKILSLFGSRCFTHSNVDVLFLSQFLSNRLQTLAQ